MTNEKFIFNVDLMNEAELDQVVGGAWRPPGVTSGEFIPPAVRSVANVKNVSTTERIHTLNDWRDY